MTRFLVYSEHVLHDEPVRSVIVEAETSDEARKRFEQWSCFLRVTEVEKDDDA